MITDRDEIVEIVNALNHATIGTRHEPLDGGGARSVLFLHDDSIIHEFHFDDFDKVFLDGAFGWIYCLQFSGATLRELYENSSAERERVYR